jgi:hypothetical protein
VRLERLEEISREKEVERKKQAAKERRSWRRFEGVEHFSCG